MELFFLKKLLGLLLMPLSLILILLFIAIFSFNKNQRLSFRCLIAGTFVLFLASLPPLSNQLMESLENDFTAYQKASHPIDYIVVLGGYHFSDDRLPATLELKTDSLQRLVEAVRIANMHPEATLIMSGSAGHNPESNAEKMKEAAILLGINEQRILTENFPKDTQEEAQLIAPRVKNTKVILITNADHMLRAMKYFHAQGVHPIAAPASFYVKGNSNVNGFDWQFYIPKSHSLEKTTIYWYEILGLTAQWFNLLFTDEPETAETNKTNVSKK